MTKIILKKGREDSLLRFHPWVFSGAIAQIVGEPAEGDIVGVFSQGGDFLAYGHYQIGSIAVRVLSFAGEDVLSPDFWKNMIARALRVRVAVGLACPVSSAAEPVSPVAEPVEATYPPESKDQCPRIPDATAPGTCQPLPDLSEAQGTIHCQRTL